MAKKIKAPSAFKKHVDSLIAYLQPRMHLNEFQVTWEYVDKIGGVPGLKPVAGTYKGFSAEVVADHVYLTIDICLSRMAYEYFREGNFKQLALDVIHELAHAYTGELSSELEEAAGKDRKRLEWVRRIDESNVERIARTIFEGLPREVWLPKKR